MQQSIAAVGLVAGNAQPDPGGAMHQPRLDNTHVHSELMFDSSCPTVKYLEGAVDKPKSTTTADFQCSNRR